MKHSKYLNSGLINLIFLKELVSEMIEKKDVKDKIKSFALTLKKLPLIKEELDVFQQFMDSYIPDKRTASRLISEIKNDIKSKDWKELGQFWTDKFVNDLKSLNIEMPDNYVKATEYIEKIIEINQKLIEQNQAYEKMVMSISMFQLFQNMGNFQVFPRSK
jgi:cysteinyl-tRNA synthetase